MSQITCKIVLPTSFIKSHVSAILFVPKHNYISRPAALVSVTFKLIHLIEKFLKRLHGTEHIRPRIHSMGPGACHGAHQHTCADFGTEEICGHKNPETG